MFRRKRTESGGHTTPRSIEVVGARTAYLEAGVGPPIVLVHAGLGGSTVWRRVIPPLSAYGRVIALDLIGTGASARVQPESDATYGIPALRTHLDSFLELLGVTDPIVFVVLGLASMPVLDWAARFPERVRAVCHMESVLEPWTFEVIPSRVGEMLDRARSPDGEAYVVFSDQHLEEAIETQNIWSVSHEDAERLRMAYGPTNKTRTAQLALMRQIPIDSEPSEAMAVVDRYSRWLRDTDIPKLLIAGRPGYFMQGALLDSARDLPNQEVAEVLGSHLLPEDAPDGVARFMSAWMRRVNQM